MTTPEAIVEAARACGVSLRVDGDQLLAKGPITPELAANIKAHKPAILAMLRGQPPAGTVQPDVKANVGDLPPGFLIALRDSGATFHVRQEGDVTALVIQPWGALPKRLQDDTLKFGQVLAAILMGAGKGALS